MGELDDLAASIAETAADYRFPHPDDRMDADRVERWTRQFPEDAQLPVLRELDHVLRNSYVSEAAAREFLAALATSEKIAGQDPPRYWERCNILQIQQNGNSQADLVAIFDEVLDHEFGLRVADCGSKGGDALYLDDAILSGFRSGNDLDIWMRNSAPTSCRIRVVVLASHTYGEFRMKRRLVELADCTKKDIEVEVWRLQTIENRRAYSRRSGVLWPAELPDSDELRAYLDEEDRFPFEARSTGGTDWPFSSEAGRQVLEREFVLAGLAIRNLAANPGRSMRPLGWGPFGLGFGSTLVTFRNCPNNAPLALWWGDPRQREGHPLREWFPLFPRTTYYA